MLTQLVAFNKIRTSVRNAWWIRILLREGWTPNVATIENSHGTLCMASRASQGCDSSRDFSWSTGLPLCHPEYKAMQFNFHLYWYREQSHVSAGISQRCLFDSVYIYFLLCGTREVYLSFREASAVNSSILTAFPLQTSWMKEKRTNFLSLFMTG
jgi:hypothetical protein